MATIDINASLDIGGMASATTPLAGTEYAVIEQGGDNKKVPVSEFGGGDNIATADLTITTNTRKLILGGALSTDYFSIRNSADTLDVLKIKGNNMVECDHLTVNNYQFVGTGIIENDTSTSTFYRGTSLHRHKFGNNNASISYLN